MTEFDIEKASADLPHIFGAGTEEAATYDQLLSAYRKAIEEIERLEKGREVERAMLRGAMSRIKELEAECREWKEQCEQGDAKLVRECEEWREQCRGGEAAPTALGVPDGDLVARVEAVADKWEAAAKTIRAASMEFSDPDANAYDNRALELRAALTGTAHRSEERWVNEKPGQCISCSVLLDGDAKHTCSPLEVCGCGHVLGSHPESEFRCELCGCDQFSIKRSGPHQEKEDRPTGEEEDYFKETCL